MLAKFEWIVNMTPLCTPTKFDHNSFKTVWAIVFAEKTSGT